MAKVRRRRRGSSLPDSLAITHRSLDRDGLRESFDPVESWLLSPTRPLIEAPSWHQEAPFSWAEVIDNRLWHPEHPPERAKRASGAPARIVVYSPSGARTSTLPSAFWPSWRLGYRSSPNVSICARRQVRREVVFARTGGGRVALRRPRRRPSSSIICRR